MKKLFFSLFILIFLVIACKDDDRAAHCSDLNNILYDPVAYVLPELIGWDVEMIIPADNPLTVDGVELGHKLFFDPILSVDSTISCSSCHDPKLAFSDNKAFSIGVNGQMGNRSSMSLLNVGFFENGLFWDGRSGTLEDQALHPVENLVEMADVWENVEMKLRDHTDYPIEFRKAFGIACKEEITRELVAKAIASYERTLVSFNTNYEKRFAQGISHYALFAGDELRGHGIYFDSTAAAGGHCDHCHDGLGETLTSNDYFNNNIEEAGSYDDFPDPGLGGVTGRQSDIGKFRAPSLRNIELTAPYMHDGRFQTLREVIDHYNSGGHHFDNSSSGSIPEQGLGLTEDDKMALELFLLNLTDTSYLLDPHYLNPFE